MFFLFSILCCENTAHIMWEEYMKKVLWCSCSLHKESTECKVDETFWKKNFERSWEFVKKNLPYSQLILEFEDFSKHQLNLDRESEEYEKLKNLTMNFLRGLYSENNIEQISKLVMFALISPYLNPCSHIYSDLISFDCMSTE